MQGTDSPSSTQTRTSAITERSAVALAAAIRSRELSASQVVEAHIEMLRRTAPLNAVVAERFDAALEEARELDQTIGGAALRGLGQDELPPLAGVPFTVKESIALE